MNNLLVGSQGVLWCPGRNTPPNGSGHNSAAAHAYDLFVLQLLLKFLHAFPITIDLAGALICRAVTRLYRPEPSRSHTCRMCSRLRFPRPSSSSLAGAVDAGGREDPRGIVERREKLLRPAEVEVYAGPVPGKA
jgi:hypothetical protein